MNVTPRAPLVVEGDRLAVPGRHLGEGPRLGTVLAVRGDAGGPPYVVEWEDGDIAVCYPGPRTEIEHREIAPVT